MTAPWKDPDLREYKRVIRHDPCAYCGGDGGTVDHIVPRPAGGARWDWENWTGACERCNRRKDRGKDGGYRSVLEVLAGRREEDLRRRRIALLDGLRPGDEAWTPWGDPGEISRIDETGIYVWIESQDREWRCGNPLSLRDALGNRLRANP